MPRDFYPPSRIRLDPDGPWAEFEIRLAQGPASIGVVGDGLFLELYGYVWLAMADKQANLVRIYRAIKNNQPVRYDSGTTDADWEEVVTVALQHTISEIKHLAFAFDKSANPVLAYERNEEIWVRQYDPLAQAFVYRGPFAGVDPVLLQDSVVGYDPPQSDVQLFHLSTDRLNLIGRYERQLYQTPQAIRTFPDPVTLDMALPTPYQVQLVGSFVGFLGSTGYVVRSMLYPIQVGETISTSTLSPAQNWEYSPLVLITQYEETPTPSVAASLNVAASWAYIPYIIIYTWEEESGGVVIADAATDVWIGDPLLDIAIGIEGQGITPALYIAASWDYAPVVVVYTAPTTDTLPTQTLAVASSWNYALVVIVVNTTTDPGYPGRDDLPGQTLAVASSWSYEPA